MSSGDTSLVFVSIIGGIMALLFGGGIYYANSGDSLGAPTGMQSQSWEAYSQSKNTNSLFGGKKTNKRKKKFKRTRKL
jgi:hypothetical protein